MDKHEFIQICVSFFVIVISTILSVPITKYILPIFPALGKPIFSEAYKEEVEKIKDTKGFEFWAITCFLSSPLISVVSIILIDKYLNLEIDIKNLVYIYMILWPIIGFLAAKKDGRF